MDLHLAELYGVETRILKQAVRRNMERFPQDLMFELTEDEVDTVVSQNVIPHKKHFGGATPFAFTEIIMEKIEMMEANYDQKFSEVFGALKYLLGPPPVERARIGYKKEE